MSEPIDFEKLSFGLIVKVSEAKNFAFEALNLAKKNKKKEAETKLGQARKAIGEAGHMHMDVVSKEAQGEDIKFSVLFMHAEDQLLTVQTLIDIFNEMIEQQYEINNLKKLVNKK